VQKHFAVAPPAAGIGRNLCRHIGGSTPLAQFAIGGFTALPLFKLDGPHAMAHPLIQIPGVSASGKWPFHPNT